MALPDELDASKTPTPKPRPRENDVSEVKAHGDMASQSFEPKHGALGEYINEVNMERLGREAGEIVYHGKARAEKFFQEGLRNLTELADGARKDAKAELERKIEELEPKARQLGADASARFEYALAETEKLAVTSRTYWQKFTKFLKKYRWAILTGLVSLVFIATGHPEYILYTLLHLVMIVFAAAHTAIGVLSLIFDNLFGIEIFSSIGYALYNITYAFYAPAFAITNTVVIWLQWIHIFT